MKEGCYFSGSKKEVVVAGWIGCKCCMDDLDDNDPHLTQSIRYANGVCSINPPKYWALMLVHYTLGAECAA